MGLNYFRNFDIFSFPHIFIPPNFNSTIFIAFSHFWRQFPFQRMFSYVSYWLEFRIAFCSQNFVSARLTISFYIYLAPLFNSFFSFRLTYLFSFIHTLFSRACFIKIVVAVFHFSSGVFCLFPGQLYFLKYYHLQIN